MLVSAVVATAAPVVLVLVALLLAAVRERRSPCRPRSPFAWRFLQGARDPLVGSRPLVAGGPATDPGRRDRRSGDLP